MDGAPWTRESRNPQPPYLEFRAVLTEGDTKVRFYREVPGWLGEVLA